MKRRSDGLTALILWSALLVSPAGAASFDCTKAATPDERAVCGNAQLSGFDSQMGKAFALAKDKAEPDDRTKLLSDAHAFLSRRHRCGSDLACLTSAYVGVLEDFQSDGSDVTVPDAISALDMVAAAPPETPGLPLHEGDCTTTRIDEIGGRLNGDEHFETGTNVRFANGGSQVSYDKVDAIVQSRHGDVVLMCLTAIPKHCPPNDDRGRMYTATDMRTKKSWSLPDSQHRCGGA